MSEIKPTADVYMAAARAQVGWAPQDTANDPPFRRAIDVGFAAGVEAERGRIIAALAKAFSPNTDGQEISAMLERGEL